MGSHGVPQVVAGERLLDCVELDERCLGPSTWARATARLSRTTGVGSYRSSMSYSVRTCSQSVPAVGASAWQAAMAACSCHRPGRRRYRALQRRRRPGARHPIGLVLIAEQDQLAVDGTGVFARAMEQQERARRARPRAGGLRR